MKLKTVAYMIRCLTNMHVGKGDATYEVVDKCVQRDVTTGVPCIYSSSLKGALRHFFTSRKFAYIDHVFGSDMSRDGENENKKNEKEYSVGNFLFSKPTYWHILFRASITALITSLKQTMD